MKRIIYFTIIAIILLLVLGCETPGTMKNIDEGNSEKYNIEKYYYDDAGNYIIIATRKDSLEVSSTTWKESHGKNNTVTKTVILDENDRPIKYIPDTVYQYRKEDILLKNDSIIIIRK